MTSPNDSNDKPPEPPKNKGGRPTGYDPAFCERVVELGKEGKSLANIAAEFDVVRNTLKDWARLYPEFSIAMERARELALNWWETEGQKGIWAGKEFNAQAYRLQVMNRFPADWRDQKHVEFKGALAQIDMSKLSDSQLARIVAGEHPLQVLAEVVEGKEPPAERRALPAGDQGEGEEEG